MCDVVDTGGMPPVMHAPCSLLKREAETPIISWLTPHEDQRELFRDVGVLIVAPHVPEGYYEKIDRNTLPTTLYSI